jgi:hypothetical protein
MKYSTTIFVLMLSCILLSDLGASGEFQTPVMGMDATPVSTAAPSSPNVIKPKVGMPVVIKDLILPGTELEATSQTDDLAPVVLRVINVFPHGTQFRYELEYYGMVPGTFDLKNFLQRKDASTTADLPAIPVEIISVSAPGQLIPRDPSTKRTAWFHYYQLILCAAIILWTITFWSILKIGRRKKAAQELPPEFPSSIDHLTHYAQQMEKHDLNAQERAEVERLVYAAWREKLGLQETHSNTAVMELKQNAVAGHAIRKLEAWLHAPQTTPIDLNQIIAELYHYENVPDHVGPETREELAIT